MSSVSVSIIIPVYNTAPWLRRCLDSACGQTLENIEIICVNDGSTDDSRDILAQYAAQDSRVRYIEFKRNHGVSVTRNAGMAAARGSWLGFMDSDDAVAPDFYEKLHAAAIRSGADIVKGVRWSERNAPQYIDPDFNHRIRKDKFEFTNEWTTAIYSKMMLKNNSIRFLPKCIRNQDVAFLYGAVLCSKYISVIDDAVYYYYNRQGSANTLFLNYKKLVSYILSIKKICSYLNKYIPDNIQYIDKYSKLITGCIDMTSRTTPESKHAACMYLADELPKIIKNCRFPEQLLQKFRQYYPEIEQLLRHESRESLADWLSLTRIQRLRRAAVSRMYAR